jgi:hypothetical protein
MIVAIFGGDWKSSALRSTMEQNMLLNGELEPITSQMGLIAADVGTAADCFQAWQNEILQDSGMRVSRRRCALSGINALKALPPLTSPVPTRFGFFATKSNWSVYFDNSNLGTQSATVMPVIAKKLNCEGIRVVQVKQTLPAKPKKDSRGNFGATILEVFGTDMDYKRSIAAVNDGGRWVFEQSGAPYPFEDLSAYDRRLKRERFTEEMLVNYLMHFDTRPFDEDWYGDQSIVLAREGDFPGSITEYELAEYR